MLRIVILTLFIIFFISEHALAFDLDMTVDDDIRKNYNSSKLVTDTNTEDLEELPALPEKLKNTTVDSKQKSNQIHDKKISMPAPVKKSGNIKIPKGSVINAASTSKISDWQKAGAVVKFKTQTTAIKKRYSIPAGTVFIGEILESHQPQITCNGGLVVIRIRSMIYKNQTVPLNAYVIRADGKKIFLNNIKGNRTYLKTMWKKGNWGRNIFNRMLTLTVNLGGEGSTLLLAPFPFAYGTICLGANTLVSPITAFFSKGGHVSIPSGSQFRIKLLEDTYVD